ncbi:MAG: helix-turn-helix transcriptional regulator [Nocardioidaceae bacterium]|nr:MAG: helix-turn-helix transcriptional regulator [Nocardioidaceae bacterium]
MIYKRREAFEMTQQQLAKAAGVSLKTISNLENDESLIPQRGTLRKVREALGLSTDLATARKQASRDVDKTDLVFGPQTAGGIEALDELKAWLESMDSIESASPPSGSLWIFADEQLLDELRRRLDSRAQRVRDLGGITAAIARGKQLRSQSDADAIASDPPATPEIEPVAAHEEDVPIEDEQGHDENP